MCQAAEDEPAKDARAAASHVLPCPALVWPCDWGGFLSPHILPARKDKSFGRACLHCRHRLGRMSDIHPPMNSPVGSVALLRMSH